MKGEDIKLVVFDMDGVLTVHPSSWEYVHRHLGVDNHSNLQLYRQGKISYMEFLRSDVRLWTDADPELRKEDVVDILNTIPLRNGIGEAVETIRRCGSFTAIISGGIYWLADRISSLARFDRIFANQIMTDENGRILPDGKVLVEPRNKDKVLKQLQNEMGVSREETASIGDTLQDVAMFRNSGISVAFNATDERVRDEASFSVDGNDLRVIIDLICHGKGGKFQGRPPL